MQRMPFYPPEKRAQGFDVVRYRRRCGERLGCFDGFPATPGLGGAGERCLGASLFGLDPVRVVGRDGWVHIATALSCLVLVAVCWLLRCLCCLLYASWCERAGFTWLLPILLGGSRHLAASVFELPPVRVVGRADWVGVAIAPPRLVVATAWVLWCLCWLATPQ